MRCASCGSENPDSNRFCGDCGSPLGNRCVRCGVENPASQKFCGDCGADLFAAVSGVSPGNAMLDCSNASPRPLPTSPKLARWSPTDSTNLGRSRVRERRTLGSVSAKAEWLVSTPGQNYITGPN